MSERIVEESWQVAGAALTALATLTGRVAALVDHAAIHEAAIDRFAVEISGPGIVWDVRLRYELLATGTAP